MMRLSHQELEARRFVASNMMTEEARGKEWKESRKEGKKRCPQTKASVMKYKILMYSKQDKEKE